MAVASDSLYPGSGLPSLGVLSRHGILDSSCGELAWRFVGPQGWARDVHIVDSNWTRRLRNWPTYVMLTTAGLANISEVHVLTGAYIFIMHYDFPATSSQINDSSTINR